MTITRRQLGAMSVLAAMTCGAPAVYGQMAAGDSGARPVILTFSYTGELVQNAGGGARHGTTFAGAAGGEVTLLIGRSACRAEPGTACFAGGRVKSRRPDSERRAERLAVFRLSLALDNTPREE